MLITAHFLKQKNFTYPSNTNSLLKCLILIPLNDSKNKSGSLTFFTSSMMVFQKFIASCSFFDENIAFSSRDTHIGQSRIENDIHNGGFSKTKHTKICREIGRRFWIQGVNRKVNNFNALHLWVFK